MSKKSKLESVKSDAEIAADKQILDLQRKLEAAKRAERAQKLRADETEKLLEDFYASTFEIARQKLKRGRPSKTHIRVAFGDTHGSHIDQAAWRAFIEDVKILKPKEIVHGGDIVEAGGFLAQHHTLGYVAETEYTYSDDVSAANQMWDQLQDACPNAEIHAVQGNHDARIEKIAVNMALRNRADAELLRKALDPQYLMHLEKRGIHWYRRAEKYGESQVPGTVLLGKCYFTHPQTASKHHAAQMVSKFKDNVVFFHTHRRDSYAAHDAKGNEFGAWNPGCLCLLQKYYMHSEQSSHSHGYHLQFVQSDGSFLPINVPIINGKSYLSGLLGS